jgi:hypothetical protein
MKSVFVVYKTDMNHSYKSRDIIGIATSDIMAVKICTMQAKKENEQITKEQLWNLSNLKQTQGYNGEGEFQFEEIKTDTLL